VDPRVDSDADHRAAGHSGGLGSTGTHAGGLGSTGTHAGGLGSTGAHSGGIGSTGTHAGGIGSAGTHSSGLGSTGTHAGTTGLSNIDPTGTRKYHSLPFLMVPRLYVLQRSEMQHFRHYSRQLIS
jgi:hypothetical protein